VGRGFGVGGGLRLGVVVGVAVGVRDGVAVAVGVGVEVGVGVGVGVSVDVTSTYLESLGMPLVKAVTEAGPEGKSIKGVDVKALSDRPAVGSTGRKAVSSLSMLRNWTDG
jgi:hypothetical protein